MCNNNFQFHFLYISGYKKIVRKLLRYANVNVKNNDGETPLFFAVDGCNIKSLSNKIKYYRMKMFRFLFQVK